MAFQAIYETYKNKKDSPLKRYASAYPDGSDSILWILLNKREGLETTSQLLNLRNLPKYIPKDITSIMSASMMDAVFSLYLSRIILSMCDREYRPSSNPAQAEVKTKKVSYKCGAL